MGDTAGSTTRANVGWPAPSASTISNLQAYSSSQPGTGNTLVFTLYDGSTAEGITCTITATANSCSDNTHTFTPSAGDLLSWQITPTGTVVITPNIQIGAAWATPGSGAVTATSYQSLAIGNAAITISPTAGNRIQTFAISFPVNVSFSHIYLTSHTADASGLYTANWLSATGGILCHPTSGTAVPTANTVWTNTCSEGTVTFSANTTYILAITGNATTASLNGTTPGGVGLFWSANTSGCSSSSGVLSGTCTISLTPTDYGGIPSFFLQ